MIIQPGAAEGSRAGFYGATVLNIDHMAQYVTAPEGGADALLGRRATPRQKRTKRQRNASWT